MIFVANEGMITSKDLPFRAGHRPKIRRHWQLLRCLTNPPMRSPKHSPYLGVWFRWVVAEISVSERDARHGIRRTEDTLTRAKLDSVVVFCCSRVFWEPMVHSFLLANDTQFPKMSTLTEMWIFSSATASSFPKESHPG